RHERDGLGRHAPRGVDHDERPAFDGARLDGEAGGAHDEVRARRERHASQLGRAAAFAQAIPFEGHRAARRELGEGLLDLRHGGAQHAHVRASERQGGGAHAQQQQVVRLR
ncbi:MAG: hypothetical protein ACK56I_19470, partial [bacterium]